VIGRMLDDRLYIDCRTVLSSQVTALAAAIGRAAAAMDRPAAASET
jgi:hypothetical protein